VIIKVDLGILKVLWEDILWALLGDIALESLASM
jgi:hypothetical protein